ncbi:MAG TPA: HEAT repeat domain-containing protein [Planctomycetota bacterium]|nr:HEAT repeat domain-containing protein [Planctomycetota bacterium]
MSTCQRCGEPMAPEEAACSRCERGMNPEPAPFETLPPKRCPWCRTVIAAPAVEGLLHCPSCAKGFEDEEEWVRRCRAAAFIATRPIPHPPEPPPPRPAWLGAAGGSLLVSAAFYLAVGLFIGRSGLIVPCIALALIQVIAGTAVLTGWRSADSFVRFAAGVSVLVPLFSLPAIYFVGLFALFCRPEVLKYYGGRHEALPDRLRHPMLAWLIVVIAVAAGVQVLVVAEAVDTARRWNDPLSPLLDVGARTNLFFVQHWLWAPVGVLGGLCILGLWGKINRPGFLAVATLSIAAVVALCVPAAVEAHVYSRQALEAAKYVDEKDVQRLLWGSREPDAKVRVAALWAMEATNRSARIAVPVFTRALGDPDRRVRLAGACGMARFDPAAEGILPVLLSALEDDRASADEADRASRALGYLGPRAHPALSLLVDRFRRSEAPLLAMVELAPASIPGVTAQLGDADPEARRRAARVLRLIGPAARSAAGPLALALKDADPGVRADAALALGEIQRDKAVDLLRPLLADDPAVARAAAEALCSLGLKDGLPKLAEGSNALNALRTPAIWDHLSRTFLDKDVEGTATEIVIDLGERAVMCPEVSPECSDLPSLQPFRRLFAATRRRSVLEALTSLDAPFVLDSDRLRILTPEQARAFWTEWLAASQKRRE